MFRLHFLSPHFIFLGITLLLATLSCKNQEREGVKLVTPEEMQNILETEDVQLVDVRTPEEYKEGYIKNSQNIDYNSPTFDEDINKLDKTNDLEMRLKLLHLCLSPQGVDEALSKNMHKEIGLDEKLLTEL